MLNTGENEDEIVLGLGERKKGVVGQVVFSLEKKNMKL